MAVATDLVSEIQALKVERHAAILAHNYQIPEIQDLADVVAEITAAAGPLFENANKLLDNLDVTVTGLKKDLGDFTPKLGPLADSLKMDVDNLQNMITNLEGVEKGADTFLGSADTFIKRTDKQLQDDLKQLNVTLLNLKVVTTYAKELVGTLAEKPNRVIFSGKPATLTPESEILKSSKPVPARKP